MSANDWVAPGRPSTEGVYHIRQRGYRVAMTYTGEVAENVVECVNAFEPGGKVEALAKAADEVHAAIWQLKMNASYVMPDHDAIESLLAPLTAALAPFEPDPQEATR